MANDNGMFQYYFTNERDERITEVNVGDTYNVLTLHLVNSCAYTLTLEAGWKLQLNLTYGEDMGSLVDGASFNEMELVAADYFKIEALQGTQKVYSLTLKEKIHVEAGSEITITLKKVCICRELGEGMIYLAYTLVDLTSELIQSRICLHKIACPMKIKFFEAMAGYPIMCHASIKWEVIGADVIYLDGLNGEIEEVPSCAVDYRFQVTSKITLVLTAINKQGTKLTQELIVEPEQPKIKVFEFVDNSGLNQCRWEVTGATEVKLNGVVVDVESGVGNTIHESRGHAGAPHYDRWYADLVASSYGVEAKKSVNYDSSTPAPI